MYKRVVNKKARYNLCFADDSQEPKYEEGKGRIVSYDTVPLLNALRFTLPQVIGEKGDSMIAEGNFYYDTDKCGIGWHGDTERRKVIAIRLGKSMNICYQWYLNNIKVGDKAEFILNNGDMYIMSEKATGCDWKKRKIYTLRHAAGAAKYTA
jgi:alkylated DNA repair dioxygenase AlkB